MTLDINQLISQYGYAALLVGSLAEGETITLLGGVAVHQGLLRFPLVVLAVAWGALLAISCSTLLAAAMALKFCAASPATAARSIRRRRLFAVTPICL